MVVAGENDAALNPKGLGEGAGDERWGEEDCRWDRGAQAEGLGQASGFGR